MSEIGSETGRFARPVEFFHQTLVRLFEMAAGFIEFNGEVPCLIVTTDGHPGSAFDK